MRHTYLYRITCKKTGRFYLGKRSINSDNPEEDIHYWGSGDWIKNEITRLMNENFTKEILEVFPSQKRDDRKKISKKEHQLIKQNWWKQWCMNKAAKSPPIPLKHLEEIFERDSSGVASAPVTL